MNLLESNEERRIVRKEEKINKLEVVADSGWLRIVIIHSDLTHLGPFGGREGGISW